MLAFFLRSDQNPQSYPSSYLRKSMGLIVLYLKPFANLKREFTSL